MSIASNNERMITVLPEVFAITGASCFPAGRFVPSASGGPYPDVPKILYQGNQGDFESDGRFHGQLALHDCDLPIDECVFLLPRDRGVAGKARWVWPVIKGWDVQLCNRYQQKQPGKPGLLIDACFCQKRSRAQDCPGRG